MMKEILAELRAKRDALLGEAAALEQAIAILSMKAPKHTTVGDVLQGFQGTIEDIQVTEPEQKKPASPAVGRKRMKTLCMAALKLESLPAAWTARELQKAMLDERGHSLNSQQIQNVISSLKYRRWVERQPGACPKTGYMLWAFTKQ